jgi:hypothetical protein
VSELSHIPDLIKNWLENFIERPHPALGDWPPCPYARQARINECIAFVGVAVQQLESAVAQYAGLLETHDVVVMYFDHYEITPGLLQQQVQDLNHKIMGDDLVILEDHPGSPELINGVSMNFGACGLAILQKLSDLNQASDQLRNKGYYNVWSSDNLAAVVNWRYRSDFHTDENQ